MSSNLAAKTFGAEEEREGVDSYSARLRPWGAVLLLLVNVAAAYLAFYHAAVSKFSAVADLRLLGPAAAVTLIVVIAGALYAFRPDKAFAKLCPWYGYPVSSCLSGTIAASIYLLVYR